MWGQQTGSATSHPPTALVETAGRARLAWLGDLVPGTGTGRPVDGRVPQVGSPTGDPPGQPRKEPSPTTTSSLMVVAPAVAATGPGTGDSGDAGGHRITALRANRRAGPSGPPCGSWSSSSYDGTKISPRWQGPPAAPMTIVRRPRAAILPLRRVLRWVLRPGVGDAALDQPFHLCAVIERGAGQPLPGGRAGAEQDADHPSDPVRSGGHAPDASGSRAKARRRHRTIPWCGAWRRGRLSRAHGCTTGTTAAGEGSWDVGARHPLGAAHRDSSAVPRRAGTRPEGAVRGPAGMAGRRSRATPGRPEGPVRPSAVAREARGAPDQSLNIAV